LREQYTIDKPLKKKHEKIVLSNSSSHDFGYCMPGQLKPNTGTSKLTVFSDSLLKPASTVQNCRSCNFSISKWKPSQKNHMDMQV
jgi:hypothetical protein